MHALPRVSGTAGCSACRPAWPAQGRPPRRPGRPGAAAATLPGPPRSPRRPPPYARPPARRRSSRTASAPQLEHHRLQTSTLAWYSSRTDIASCCDTAQCPSKSATKSFKTDQALLLRSQRASHAARGRLEGGARRKLARQGVALAPQRVPALLRGQLAAAAARAGARAALACACRATLCAANAHAEPAATQRQAQVVAAGGGKRLEQVAAACWAGRW